MLFLGQLIRIVWRRQAKTLALAAALAMGQAWPSLADPLDTEPAGASVDPDYVAGRKALDAKDWNAAIKSLSSAARRNPANADIQNYLGFAYRKAAKLDLAFKHYKQALSLDPRHRGAHEYIGEAYLMRGDLKNAETHLAALREICRLPCEELADLEREIAAHVKNSSMTTAR